MTSIPANVQNFLPGSRTAQPKVQQADSKEDFSKVLDRQKTGTPKENSVNTPKQTKVSDSEPGKAQGQTETPQEAETEQGVQTENGDVKTDEAAAGQNQQQEAAEAVSQPNKDVVEGPTEEELSGEMLEQVMEILQSAILQIQELLVQQLNISPQELEQLMQKAGFTEFQLLQPETVNQLILEATGAEDPVALVMDESLYHSQQVITRGFQEITQEVARSLEELEDEGGLTKALDSLENVMSGKAMQDTGDAAQGLQQESGQEKQGRQDRKSVV